MFAAGQLQVKIEDMCHLHEMSLFWVNNHTVLKELYSDTSNAPTEWCN